MSEITRLQEQVQLPSLNPLYLHLKPSQTSVGLFTPLNETVSQISLKPRLLSWDSPSTFSELKKPLG